MDEREWKKWGSFGGNDFLRSGRMDETLSCTRSSSCPAPRFPGRSGSMLDHLSPSPGRSDALAAAPVGLLIVSDLKRGWPPSTGQWLPPFRGEASYFAVGLCSLCLPACLHAPHLLGRSDRDTIYARLSLNPARLSLGAHGASDTVPGSSVGLGQSQWGRHVFC